MRRLDRRSSRRLRKTISEDGTVLVFVGLASVVLIGFTALAIDMGRLYSERRELQTGADAAALAVAQTCAGGGCTGPFDPYVLSEQYADLNARDGHANVADVDLDLAARRVTVETQTEDQAGQHDLDLLLAQVLGFDHMDVRADATVVWGSPGTLPTLPLAFSTCEWELFGEPGYVEDGGSNFLHHAASVTAGLMPPASGYLYESRSAVVYFHGDVPIDDTLDCHESPSGQDLAGGFGWLDADPGQCQATVSLEDWVSIDPGASPVNGCSPAEMAALVGTVALFPYFDDVQGTGNNATYHISGFGALYVTGFNFGGPYKQNSLITGAPVCSGSSRCMEGYFIGDWVVTGGGGIGGPGQGVIAVEFVS